MKHQRNEPVVSLFPFLSVLLSTMGVLAFLSISLLLISQEDERENKIKTHEFQWVGAPGYVEPIYFRCHEDRIQYYDLFSNRNRTISFESLLGQIRGEDQELIQYLLDIVQLNKNIKREFGETEYYPLLLVYPNGVFASELLMAIIEQIDGLNVGLEPMLNDWQVPYQDR